MNSPFKRIALLISGELPSTFKQTLSYFESLECIVNFIENKILPNVNTNSENIATLTGIVNDLKNYVNTYFDNLDVQEEINHKLDEMASDGTLTNLIKEYIDPLFNDLKDDLNLEINELETNINETIDFQNNNIARMQRQVNSAVSGAPIPVSSLDDMIDTEKLYLLTSDGYWYYYDGSDWVRGEIYQSAVSPEGVSFLEESKMDKTKQKTNINALASESGAKKIDGSVTSNVYNTFKTFDVSEHSFVFVNGRNHTAVEPLAIFYDSSWNMISYVATGTSNQDVENYRLSVPVSAKYLIVNGRTSTPEASVPTCYYFIYYDFIESFNHALRLNEYYNSIPNKMNKTIDFISIDAISSSLGAKHVDGSVTENSNNTFKTFEVEDKNKIYVSGRNHTANEPLCLFYTSDMQYISKYATGTNNDDVINREVDVPANAKYVIVNGRTSTPEASIPSCKYTDYLDFTESLEKYLSNIEYISKTTPLKNQYKNGGLASIFPKIACIGDSLTKGGMEWSNGSGVIDYSLYSYPTQMARVLGVTVYNMGSSGACASPVASTQYNDWNWKATQENWFSNDYKAYAYIIALGTNDIGFAGSFTGNVETDIDDNDYNNNAQTSVGGYAKIIQRIKELQSRAKIFCVTIPNTRNTLSTRSSANEKIRSIANHFNCFIIDLEEYGVQPTDVTSWKAIYYNIGHLNCLGYKELSNMILQYLDFIILNNPRSFYDVPAEETDYH